MLISFEGIDGSGKTTIIKHVKHELEQQGLTVKSFQEPGTSQMGNEIRKLLKTNIKRTPLSELLLYEASRADMVESLVIPAMTKYNVIILDRYTDSTIAYQGYGNKNNIDVIKSLNSLATNDLTPDLSFFIDVTVKEAKKRRIERNNHDTDVLDYDDEYAQRVYSGYKDLPHLIAIKNDNLETAVNDIVKIINAHIGNTKYENIKANN